MNARAESVFAGVSWSMVTRAIAVALWLLSWARGAWAQPSTEVEHPRAIVVLVGSAQNDDLTEVLSELLNRESVELSFQRKPNFQPGVFLAENDRDTSVWVFVKLRDKDRVRLYFRGPHGRRFLLRDLRLKNGLDEVGRELIGQVVDSSVSALLHSSVGISREQARAALASEEQDAAKQKQPTAKPEAKPGLRAEAKPAQIPSSGTTTWEFAAGIRGSGSSLGPDHPLQYGPGLEFGAGLRIADSLWLRARGLFDYTLPGQLDSDPVRAELQTTVLRAGLDCGFVTRGHGLFFGLSAGADVVRIDPRSTNDPRINLSAASTDTVPMARAGLSYEYTLSNFRLGVGPFVDLALEETHYDLSFNGASRRLATPWRLRPGFALVLGFSL